VVEAILVDSPADLDGRIARRCSALRGRIWE
jgi:hypothetical protein